MIDAPRERFSAEMAAFEEQRQALVRTALSKWVILLGSDLAGPFDTYAAAWTEGIQRWGRPGFLVKQILPEDHPVMVSHICLHEDEPKS